MSQGFGHSWMTSFYRGWWMGFGIGSDVNWILRPRCYRYLIFSFCVWKMWHLCLSSRIWWRWRGSATRKYFSLSGKLSRVCLRDRGKTWWEEVSPISYLWNIWLRYIFRCLLNFWSWLHLILCFPKSYLVSFANCPFPFRLALGAFIRFH